MNKDEITTKLNNNINITKELEIDYKDIDPQKANISPRNLFNQIHKINNINSMSIENSPISTDYNSNSNSFINKKIENTLESYLDLVKDYYFKEDFKRDEYKDEINESKFKLSSLDFLLNPLRTPMPFEMWSPYEIALFESCLCKFGRDFELIGKIITTKNKMEIQEFYYQWEKSKYHDVWLGNLYKKRQYNK